jgi:hypothetical protein
MLHIFEQCEPTFFIRFQYLWWTDEVPVDLSDRTSVDPTTGGKKFHITNQGTVRRNIAVLL